MAHHSWRLAVSRYLEPWEYVSYLKWNLRICHKNGRSFDMFCEKRYSKFQNYVTICEHFQRAATFLAKYFRRPKFVSMYKTKETIKICHRNSRSSHIFFRKSSSKLEKPALSWTNLHFFWKNIQTVKVAKHVKFEMNFENKL